MKSKQTECPPARPLELVGEGSVSMQKRMKGIRGFFHFMRTAMEVSDVLARIAENANHTAGLCADRDLDALPKSLPAGERRTADGSLVGTPIRRPSHQ